MGTPAGTITTTPQRPLVTPATPATPGTAHQATKPVTPAVSANPPPSAPTGAATNVRPFEQPTSSRLVVTPHAVPSPGLQHSNPVTPRSESPRLPIYTPPPSSTPSGRPNTSATPTPGVTTLPPIHPAPSYNTVPPARESRPFQPKQVEAQPRIIRPAPSSDAPSSGRPSGVSPGTDRSRPSPDKDPANPNKRQ
ncbi:hypothetical protein LBMAG56_36900 [Verrucomicrobiota bacterium]|nr:hypothetical protein LBMAG56_36900 [Verrucomicrobiota bacterium]